MTEETEREKLAIERVKAANPGSSHFSVTNTYFNIMDGILVEVGFKTQEGTSAWNHVHFGKNISVFRLFHEVCTAMVAYKETSFFFRLLSLTGVSGLIALCLIGVFSVLLCIMALSSTTPNPSIIEVIKLSFAIILGYFFGSQAPRK
ncbi:MAG: hypothetical protein PHT85_14675 [Methylovulum sp.]|nr:hypothetical protein [Methylovulum sp.]